MRKIITPLLSLVFAICLVFSVTACKKEPVNKEYNEYSEKVITVLNDYGIKVYNLDSKKSVAYAESQLNNVADVAASYQEGSTLAPLSAKAAAAAEFTPSKGEIFDKLNNSERSPKELTPSIQDACEQTFYFPLVMGRALTDSLKVKSFYGETACVAGNQFIVTNQNGSHSVTHAFIENGYGSNGNHYYVAIDLDYTDSNNYEFVMVSYDEGGSTKSFYYGNDSQEFIHLYISDDLKLVEYQDRDKNGYVYNQSELVDDIYALVAGEFSKNEKKTFTDLKANSKHNITEEAYYNAVEAIFGDTGKTTVSGLVADGDCALYYVASSGEETVTIPDNIKYLSADFEIQDKTGSVRTLVIPSSVIGIKNGQESVDVDSSELKIFTSGPIGRRPLNCIVVEEGSTIFQSGTGHLRDLHGNIVCYANYAHSTGKIDARDLLGFRKLMNNAPTENYPIFFESITEAAYDCVFAGEVLQGEMGEEELYQIFNQMLHYCTRVSKVSVKIDREGEYLSVNAYDGLTLLLDVPNHFQVTVEGAGRGNLFVTVLNESCFDLAVECDAQWSQINCTLPWTKQYYEYLETMGNCNILFKQKAPEEIQWTFAEGEDHYVEGITVEHDGGTGSLMATVNCAATQAFTIPADYYGNTIDTVYIVDNTTADVTISIPSTVKKVYFKEVSKDNSYGANVLINYDGPYLSFQGVIRAEDWFVDVVTQFFVGVRCDDFEGYYNNNIKVSIQYLNKSSDVTVNIKKNEAGEFTYYAELVTYALLDDYHETKVYYYTESGSSGDMRYVVEWIMSVGYKITIPFESVDAIRDMVLIYHEEMRTLNLSIDLVDENGTVTTIHNVYLPFYTRVTIYLLFDESENKNYIIIEYGERGDSALGQTVPWTEVRFEIPNGKGFRAEAAGMTSETNSFSFEMYTDQTIRLQLIDYQS